jgi:hypothetical protein
MYLSVFSSTFWPVSVTADAGKDACQSPMQWQLLRATSTGTSGSRKNLTIRNTSGELPKNQFLLDGPQNRPDIRKPEPGSGLESSAAMRQLEFQHFVLGLLRPMEARS